MSRVKVDLTLHTQAFKTSESNVDLNTARNYKLFNQLENILGSNRKLQQAIYEVWGKGIIWDDMKQLADINAYVGKLIEEALKVSSVLKIEESVGEPPANNSITYTATNAGAVKVMQCYNDSIDLGATLENLKLEKAKLENRLLELKIAELEGKE